MKKYLVFPSIHNYSYPRVFETLEQAIEATHEDTIIYEATLVELGKVKKVLKEKK